MGIFVSHHRDFTDIGLPVFPVDARAKRPLVRGWQKATAPRARALAGDPRFAEADAIGLVMGPTSRLVEVDVDDVSDAWLGFALERFGETPIQIRTATGKAKLWYRHAGERRLIRPIPGEPIDILGAGYTICPPSRREDLGAAYSFERGGLADVADLPSIRPGALDFAKRPDSAQVGERNIRLWRHLMVQARHADDFEALLDVAETWAAAMSAPLPPAEVRRCAQSAWRYETTGRNYVGLTRPAVTPADRVMDSLLDEPDAFLLLCYFRRWHTNRSAFAIAPSAMSLAGSPPWHRSRISRARDVLVERGLLIEICGAIRGVRSGRYRLAEEMSESGKDHYTPGSPWPGGGPRDA